MTLTSTQRISELWSGGKARVFDNMIIWAQRHGCVWFRLRYCSNSTRVNDICWLNGKFEPGHSPRKYLWSYLNCSWFVFKSIWFWSAQDAPGVASELSQIPQVSMQSLNVLVRQELGPKVGWKLCLCTIMARKSSSFLFLISGVPQTNTISQKIDWLWLVTPLRLDISGECPIPQVRTLFAFFVFWNPSGQCLVEVKDWSFCIDHQTSWY